MGHNIQLTRNANPRIGLIGINPFTVQKNDSSPEQLLRSVGRNTGNLVFTHAIYKQLAGTVEGIGFRFDPILINQNYDLIVIAASNWLNAYANWNSLCDLLERVNIPVVTVGIGIQAQFPLNQEIVVHPANIRLAKLLAKKSNCISCRGELTRSWFHSIGVKNVITTGCPSFYMKVNIGGDESIGHGLVVQSTRHRMSKAILGSNSINKQLYKLAADLGVDIIYQSEQEEIEHLVIGQNVSDEVSHGSSILCELYGFGDYEKYKSYLATHGKVFSNVADWVSYLKTKSGLISTRIHGSVLALNAGLPTLMLAHDLRTSEMIEFAKIPTANVADTSLQLTELQLLDKVRSANMTEYLDTRKKNMQIYLKFLSLNDLTPNLNNFTD